MKHGFHDHLFRSTFWAGPWFKALVKEGKMDSYQFSSGEDFSRGKVKLQSWQVSKWNRCQFITPEQ